MLKNLVQQYVLFQRASGENRRQKRTGSHYEGNLVLGKYKRSALGTREERTTPLPLGARKIIYAEAFKGVPEALKRKLPYGPQEPA